MGGMCLACQQTIGRIRQHSTSTPAAAATPTAGSKGVFGLAAGLMSGQATFANRGTDSPRGVLKAVAKSPRSVLKGGGQQTASAKQNRTANLRTAAGRSVSSTGSEQPGTGSSSSLGSSWSFAATFGMCTACTMCTASKDTIAVNATAIGADVQGYRQNSDRPQSQRRSQNGETDVGRMGLSISTDTDCPSPKASGRPGATPKAKAGKMSKATVRSSPRS